MNLNNIQFCKFLSIYLGYLNRIASIFLKDKTDCNKTFCLHFLNSSLRHKMNKPFQTQFYNG